MRRFVKFVSNICPKCGAEIFSDAAEGLCTACLLETGIGVFTETAVTADESERVARKKNWRPYKKNTPRSFATAADSLLASGGSKSYNPEGSNGVFFFINLVFPA